MKILIARLYLEHFEQMLLNLFFIIIHVLKIQNKNGDFDQHYTSCLAKKSKIFTT